MSKNRKAASSTRNRPSPLVIIGGSVLVLAVAFVVISQYVLDHRDPEASRVIAERKAESSAPHTPGFRDDAALVFANAAGDTLASVAVEVAEDEQSRTQGLMGRKRMDEGQGMLFIFPAEEYRSFWMANTPLPLDIIFVNQAGSIVTIQRNTVPYSEESVPSTAPATFVVEVNAGFCDRHGVREGDLVRWTRNPRN